MIDVKHVAERLSSGKKIILIHGNADVDALGSAYQIKSVFGDSEIYAPSKLDRVATIVAEKMGIGVLEDANLSSYDLVVAVDTSSPELFQKEGLVVPPNSLIIDHHSNSEKWIGMDFHFDDSRTSCCEIIYDVIKASGKKLTRDAGLAILAGILTDGGHFQFANQKCIRTFADIMDECDIPIDEALQLVRAPINMSERIAAMNQIGRSRFERVGDMIVAISFSSSYEAASCRGLLAAGADVAFIGSQRDEEFRVSGRATQEMVRRGVKLDEIMQQLSKETFTEGGGHGGAAGMTGVGDAEAMCFMCMQKTMEQFRKIKAEMDAGKSNE